MLHARTVFTGSGVFDAASCCVIGQAFPKKLGVGNLLKIRLCSLLAQLVGAVTCLAKTDLP